MDGRGEAGDKNSPVRPGKYFVKFTPHRAFAGRVARTLDVSGILQQRQHAFLSVLGKGMQVKQAIVGGSGIDFEIPGVNNYTNRRVDGERDAIHEAVRDLNRMDGKRSDTKAPAALDGV